MVRYFYFAILGIFIGNISSIRGAGAPTTVLNPTPQNAPLKKDPNIINRKAVKEAIPPKTVKSGVKNPQKKLDNASKDKNKVQTDVTPKAAPDDKMTPPVKLRSLTKKTIVIDARRLDDQKFTDTIRYIQENPDVRFKVINVTINPEFVVKMMKLFKDNKIIDQIRDIQFVMLPGGDENLIINEKVFTEKVLPYLVHLEGIELSCLGVTDGLLASISKQLPHLKSVSLFGVGITDKTISNLAKSLPNLTKIHLINTSVTSKSVPVLVKEFPYLRALGISGQHFKDADYIALKEGASNYLSFSAVGQKFEKMTTVKDLLTNMPKIHTLDLSESNANDEVAKAIGEVPKGLQNLNISETQITFNGIKDIIKNRDLLKFKMNKINGIGDKELELIIASQPGLKTFHFSGAYFTDATIMTLLLKLPKLIDITLVPAKESTWILTEGVEKALALKKVKLQYLHIQGYKLPEKLRLELEKDLPKLRIEYVA